MRKRAHTFVKYVLFVGSTTYSKRFSIVFRGFAMATRDIELSWITHQHVQTAQDEMTSLIRWMLQKCRLKQTNTPSI